MHLCTLDGYEFIMGAQNAFDLFRVYVTRKTPLPGFEGLTYWWDIGEDNMLNAIHIEGAYNAEMLIALVSLLVSEGLLLTDRDSLTITLS
jgi:hypothetical protein